MTAGPEKRRRPGVVVLSLALLALLLIVMVGYWFLVVRPWTAAPDVSERRLAGLWEAVERAVAVPAAPAGPANELKGALERLAEAPDLEPILDESREEGTLSPADVDALRLQRDIGERLVRWAQAGGGLGQGGPCVAGEEFPPLKLFLLGRLTLAQADVLTGEPTREEQLRAVLYLAHVMRRGAGPLHLAVGVRLAEHAAAAAKRMRALDVLRAHPGLAPEAAEVWRGVNAEAFCADALLERHFGDLSRGWPAETPATRGVPRSWIDPGPSFFRRERAMVRWWWGERLEAAKAQALDPPRLAEALRLPDDPEALPRSLMVRLLAVDLSELIVDAGRVIEEYRGLTDEGE